MIEEQIRKLAYKLKLYGIHESFQRLSEEAASSSLHPNEFLKLILSEEELYRKNRKATTLLSRAKFRSHVEDWDHSFERGVDKPTLRGLSQLDFFIRSKILSL